MARSNETLHLDQHAEREKRMRDAHRPIYHFMPQSNWMNDPNGLIQWNGVYHMFYQYNPHGAFHSTIHWGHATSRDLVHWEHQPIALAPTPGGPDADGCWSGCAVDNNGVPTLIYSGDRDHAQRPCLATSHDNLLTWEKHPDNPVIASPPSELDLVAFRDHCVWKDGDSWYQIIGSGIKDVGGTALLYRSDNLLDWEYLHPLCVGDLRQTDSVWTGPMWECPDLFPLGDKHVLAVSVWENRHTLYPIYFVGTYTNHTFTPELVHKLDFGASFYAPQSMRDDQGRRLMWGWLREERNLESQRAAGWSGVMSLPRIVEMHPDGMLSLTPAPELQALRREHTHLGNIALSSGSMHPLDIHGDVLEMIFEVELEATASFGLVVRRSPDGEEQTVIGYDAAEQRLFVDRQQASLDQDTALDVQAGELALHDGEPLRLQVFLDRSVIEVFANERACLTSRVYPTRADSSGVALVAKNGAAQVKTMDTWQMESI